MNTEERNTLFLYQTVMCLICFQIFDKNHNNITKHFWLHLCFRISLKLHNQLLLLRILNEFHASNFSKLTLNFVVFNTEIMNVPFSGLQFLRNVWIFTFPPRQWTIPKLGHWNEWLITAFSEFYLLCDKIQLKMHNETEKKTPTNLNEPAVAAATQKKVPATKMCQMERT